MTKTLTLTSKRQATFPVSLCKELNIKPGDKITLERKELHGNPAWILHTASPPKDEWFGILRHRAKGKQHDIESIRKSIHSRKPLQ